jgi:hypothetical protein
MERALGKALQWAGQELLPLLEADPLQSCGTYRRTKGSAGSEIETSKREIVGPNAWQIPLRRFEV